LVNIPVSINWVKLDQDRVWTWAEDVTVMNLRSSTKEGGFNYHLSDSFKTNQRIKQLKANMEAEEIMLLKYKFSKNIVIPNHGPFGTFSVYR
jgi:hypothetical protein